MNKNIDSDLQSKIDKVIDYFDQIVHNPGFSIVTNIFQLDFQIIYFLHGKKNVLPSLIATSLNSTRPNIATNLKILEQKGFITRITNKENRRQIFVNLTDKGEKYFDICKVQLSYLFASWFSLLGEEETKHLFNILELSTKPELTAEQIKNFSFGD